MSETHFYGCGRLTASLVVPSMKAGCANQRFAVCGLRPASEYIDVKSSEAQTVAVRLRN